MTTDESQTNDRDSLLPTTHHGTTTRNNTSTGGGESGKYSSYKSIEFTLLKDANDTTTNTTNPPSSSTPFFKRRYKNTTYRTITMGVTSIIIVAIFVMTPSSHDGRTPLTDIVFTPENNIPLRHHAENGDNNKYPTYLSLLSPSTTEGIPFPHVDRGAYGSTPASSIVNIKLFGPHLRRERPTATNDNNDDNNVNATIDSVLTVPFPTGAFWTNFIVKPTSDRGFSYPVMCYPYGYKWNDELLQVSYPPLRRLMDDISIRDIFNPDVTLGASEGGGGRFIKSFDLLSVTLRFEGKKSKGGEVVTTPAVMEGREEGGDDSNDDDDDGDSSETDAYWESYLVQGSPFITVKYNTMTPIIRALSTFHSVTCPTTTDDDDDTCHDPSDQFTTKQTLHGTKFILTTQENLTWILVASTPLKLSFNTITRTTVTSSKPYDGVLRLALIPPATPPPAVKPGTSFPRRYEGVEDLMASNGVKRLLKMGGEVYPVGGDVTYDFDEEEDEDDEATVRFQYRTKSMTHVDDDSDSSSNEEDSLLMLALPHHTQVLPSSTLLHHPTEFDLIYQTIKGTMIPVVGSTWTWTESLTSVGFDDEASLEKLKSLDDDTLELLREQVSKDGKRVLPALGENVYGFGKQIARLAQLAHIASVLPNETTTTFNDETTTTSPLLDDIVSTLHHYLSTYLSGSNNPSSAVSDGLLYDANFGGIVSTNGLDDSSGDYGNGWYNDHHFHYGYLLYACAVLGQLNQTFVEEYEDYVDALFNDVAYNPPLVSDDDNDDDSAVLFFPAARHKSWFDGHSYASGLFPFANGKSQESSSESVNCYYGAYLWSSVKLLKKGGNNKKKELKMQRVRMNYARLLLATEIRSVKTYWHMNSVYNDYGKIDDNNKDPTSTTEAMTPASSSSTIYDTPPIYDPTFSKSFMCGNAAMMDVTVSTWFGNNPLYVHMINFMPITAITRELFDVEYVRKQFMGVIEPIFEKGGIEMAWRGYAICNQAMIDPDTAWDEALQLRSYELDQAISLSQVLYFISTMDNFHSTSSDNQTDKNASVDATLPPAITPPILDTNTAHDDDAQQTTTTTTTISQSLCSSHEACKKSGLTGNCCPTTGGTFLYCCDK